MGPVELKRRFGRKVKLLRERASLTQEQLAEKIGRTVDAVSNIERGIHATKIEIAYQIALAVKVPLYELFDLGLLGTEDRERRREVNLLLDDLHSLDTKTLRAFRQVVQSILQTQTTARKLRGDPS